MQSYIETQPVLCRIVLFCCGVSLTHWNANCQTGENQIMQFFKQLHIFIACYFYHV